MRGQKSVTNFVFICAGCQVVGRIQKVGKSRKLWPKVGKKVGILLFKK